jgi:hypothetical protein
VLHRRTVVNLVGASVEFGRFLHSSSRLRRRQFPHLDPILSCGTYNFAAVKLQRRHRVVVLDRLEDTASAQVPDLYTKEPRVREELEPGDLVTKERTKGIPAGIYPSFR